MYLVNWSFMFSNTEYVNVLDIIMRIKIFSLLTVIKTNYLVEMFPKKFSGNFPAEEKY
jgi:hypothetical protein